MSIQYSQHQSLHSSLAASGRFVRYLAGIGVTSGLITSVVAVPGAIAFPSPLPQVDDYKPTQKDFNQCTSRLLELNISVEEATWACARALVPSDLGRCVSEVARDGGIPATDALSACRQVRRPKEMASCVVAINRNLKEATASEVLDNCRRSLFPDRFADCVVGTTRAAKNPATQAMNTCVDGGYFPREVDPTFISYPLVEQPEPAPLPSYEPVPTPAPVTPAPTTPAPPTEVLPQKY
ncbi:hypothetical protein [Leptothermofonsia sp. ETS-13]|uniref:hypothetical protein n=1 Tax=Leptothermofonsia sp. ETS-13 TaxID=3035696 RepID=UPI003B9F5BE8